jgi:hypothetical protein
VRGRSDRLCRDRIIGGWSSSLLLDSSLIVLLLLLLLLLFVSSSSPSSFNAKKGVSMEDMDDSCDAMSADALWRMAGDTDIFRGEDKTDPESRLGDIERRERMEEEEEEAGVVALSVLLSVAPVTTVVPVPVLVPVVPVVVFSGAWFDARSVSLQKGSAATASTSSLKCSISTLL